MKTATEIIEGLKKGDVRTLSRCISWAEKKEDSTKEVLGKLYPSLGHARVIGFTGPPGAGKSSLISILTKKLRAQKRKVAILAVDPMSPFTGGALLGDRIRFAEHYNDESIFIRSLSTRGKLGGLSQSAREIIHFLDAFGYDDILLETVGVGQNEIDVSKLADLTVLLLVPEAGDDIQVLKAGVIEVGDLFLINKADREGADRIFSELQMLMELSGKPKDNVLKTSIKDEKTIDIALTYIDKIASGRTTPPKRLASQDTLRELLTEAIQKRVDNFMKTQVFDKKSNPYELIDSLTSKKLGDFLSKH